MFKRRKSLWLLLVPYVVFFAVLPWANHVKPRIAGFPFLTFWMFVGVVLTPVAIWLASLGDPARRRHWKGE
ncbi:DUF3311 domain-containing protein [Sulfobacillus harzensis]|uniref:DUF3311 domain-containing protein n=1 Tax=Sulfobacillus harzensis TaxID=2729629 RepID=A0A7Y0L6E8_9FIRM|nr:DUF3311 domain-containing protein [Sulfobacillus harzensis]NMP23591.1 DUF3311 domain-containing protein [Sulfobacillus harzensis]